MNNSVENLISLESLNSKLVQLLKISYPTKNNEIKSNKNKNNIFQETKKETFLLSKKIDNLLSKIVSLRLFHKKYIRIILYMNKLIKKEREIDYNKFKSQIYQEKEIISKITFLSIYLMRNNINNNKRIFNQKLFRFLILMVYRSIIPVESFILIINLFLTVGINLLKKEEKVIDNNILFSMSPLGFINDLFKALNSIPTKIINDKKHLQLIGQLITILDKKIFDYPYNLQVNKLNVWMNLLGNKILLTDKKDSNSFSYDKIITFLVKIYKYNFQSIFLFKNIFEKGSISFDYYANSMDFLSALFTEEQNRRLSNDFKIKSGFYIYNNTPLILNNIQFKINSFSLIFSFKLSKIQNEKEDIILFNMVNNENSIILKIIISRPRNILKIIASKNVEWNTNFVIDLNKDYLICIGQEKKSIGKKIHLYINKTKIKNQNQEYEYLFSSLIEMPEFDHPLLLELGKRNFEGIFGDLLIINKKIKKKDIYNLYYLKEDYSDILSSINYNYNLTTKKKKYGEDEPHISFFNSLKYQCVLKILSKDLSNVLSYQNSFPIKPYGELKYSKNNNIKIYNEIYSINDFLHQHGIEFLIFQLHKIKTLSNNNKCFNCYLYKTIHFFFEYIKMAEDYIFPEKNNKIKTELKIFNFFLSLVTILSTKKSKMKLDENIREILLDLNEIFQKKKLFLLQKMIFNILFDTQLFKNQEIKNYNKLFDEMLWNLKNNDKDNPLLLFFKILLLDDFFEIKSKEIKHKKYMDIIRIFITENKKLKVKNQINECFIQNLINIKSPKKIYHYLKIIYYEIENLKDMYKENNEFINYIVTNYNKLDNYDCKYCRNTQILCFLLNDIIIIDTNEKNEVFGYSPFGFMKNPNYNFIRCIFIQCFKLENKHKLKFIKSTLYYENELDILKKVLKIENIDILSLIDFENFIPKLDAIIKYYCFLYNEYLSNNNKNILKLLKKSIKLILDLLDKIIQAKESKNKDNINNSESNKEEKNEINIFIEKVFTCSCIKLLFILYFNIFNQKEIQNLKNIEKYILFSINTIYNPFYFYLLLPFIDLNSDNHLNKYYKSELLKKIITNIIISNNTFKINSTNSGNNKNASNKILVLNSIIILIKIYDIIIKKQNIIFMSKADKSIYIYLKYILENNILYSKYIFNVILEDENVMKIEPKNKSNNKEKKKNQNLEKEKKFKYLHEIILDIIFYFLIKRKKKSELITILNNKFNLKVNNSIFYEIDDYFLSETKNNKNISIYNYNIIQLLNSEDINTTYCNTVSADSIIFSLYYFIYFFYKQKYFSRNLKNNSQNESDNNLIDLINKTLVLLFKDCITIFQKYYKKIQKIKSKVNCSEVTFKIYYILLEHFLSKYKDTKFHFNNAKDIIAYFKNFMKNSKDMIKIERNKEYKKSIKLLENYCSDLNDSSLIILSLKYMRKRSYIPEDNFLLKINGIISENNLSKKAKNNISFKRSMSFSDSTEKNKINRFKRNIQKEAGENLHNENIIFSKIKTPIIKAKESKKVLETLETDITSITNKSNSKEIISESDSDNSSDDNNLDYNSNYNCNNSINFKEEKIRRRKNAFYLNKKITSSISLNTNLLNSSNCLNDSSENANNEEEKCQKNKLSQDNMRNTTNNYTISKKEDIVKERINEYKDDAYEKNDKHQIIIDKLKDINIPYFFYKQLTHKDQPKWARIVLNPKREIMRIFGFIFRKYIYNNRNFQKLKYCFKIKYKNKSLESSTKEEENVSLDYPTKLKNFTCNDYYRPFLKPFLNYFESEYFYNAHPYIKKEIASKDICLEDQVGKVEYEKILLIIKKKKSDFRVKCENISNKGSIYGALHLFNSLMVFQDNSKKDQRLSKEKDNTKLFYLFSSDDNDRLIGKNKNIIIYYNEIKEIILRRYCFTDIAYEIFLKDNRSYFFNFFNRDNRKKFFNSLDTQINKINNKIKEEMKYNDSNYDDKIIDLLFINEPKIYFEKKDIKSAYIKKEINNFEYLLLINKFSSRSYNNNSQYLIFPLLYMNIDKTKERDLSKPICLNKTLSEDDYIKYKNNYEAMGYHFNNHYTTMAYVLFYLMRINPFTYCQIKLQSGNFDSPGRLFSSLKNLLSVFEISDENRELCPEIFYFYECFFNLNYNDFGYISVDKKQIHHFNNSQNCGIVEFIMDLRNILETKELAPWINYIFGYKQLSDSYESYNSFATYSYEQYNNLEKEKEEISEDKNKNRKIINEKIKNIRSKIQLLSLGITPAQLFKAPHPTKGNIKENNYKKSNNIPSSGENKVDFAKKTSKKKSKNYFEINKKLIDYISKGNLSNVLYSFNSTNDNGITKIIFIFENQIKIFNYLSENDKDQEINIDLEEEITLVKIKPYRNIFIEMYENVFLFCRLVNRTLLLCFEKKKYFIEWPCIITAIEFYNHSKSVINGNVENHINKILIGDEEGNLSIIEIITEYIDKKKELTIKALSKSFKRNKAHYSYINAITYNKRLNIIISSCNSGYVTINNGYSFDILNIIKIGKHYSILDYKLSKYDLLYIYTSQKGNNEDKYELYCYTLNGIKIKKLSIEECINFYINKASIYIVYKDGNLKEYNSSNMKELKNNINIEKRNDIKLNGDAIDCFYSPKFSNSACIIFRKELKNIKIPNSN